MIIDNVPIIKIDEIIETIQPVNIKRETEPNLEVRKINTFINTREVKSSKIRKECNYSSIFVGLIMELFMV